MATLLALATPVLAQDPVVPPPVPPADTVPPAITPALPQEAPDDAQGVSPGGAFLRAVLVPGWGHAAIGSHTRGGVYLAAQGGTAWMLVRTRNRLSGARRVVEIREALVLERLEREGVTDPLEIATALEEDEGVSAARRLEDSRSQQFEDWTALGIFLVLLSGVDAFVSGHLQYFPEPVELTFTPVSGGGVEVGARLPVGFRR